MNLERERATELEAQTMRASDLVSKIREGLSKKQQVRKHTSNRVSLLPCAWSTNCSVLEHMLKYKRLLTSSEILSTHSFYDQEFFFFTKRGLNILPAFGGWA